MENDRFYLKRTTMRKLYFTTLLLLFCLILQGQNRQISISAKNKPVKDVLAEIQQNSGYRILYNDEVVPDKLRVTVNAENTAVKTILDAMLKNTGLTYIMQTDELIIIAKKEERTMQNALLGRITNEAGEPVPYANIVLVAANNTADFRQGAVSDIQGYYHLTNLKPGEYQLQVSFIGYKTEHSELSLSPNSQEPVVRDFVLKTDTQILEELVVKGQQPALKVENGRLIYHIPSLLKNKSLTNAYDALKEIPGVTEQDGRLTLIGANGMTVLLNGKKSSMTDDQLTALLKSVPVSRVEDIEIMYSAPPQYNIKGAAINIILKEEGESPDKWQGEIAVEYAQKSDAGGNGKASLFYPGKKTTVDLLYAYKHRPVFSKEELSATHTLENQAHLIRQTSKGKNAHNEHTTRMGVSHTFDNKDRVDASYTGIFDRYGSDRSAIIDISSQRIDTQTGSDGTYTLHNIQGDYAARFGLTAGGDYTYYHNQTDYHLLNIPQDATATERKKITSSSKQTIHRTFLYAHQKHSITKLWQLNYGVNYSLAHTQNRSDGKKNDLEYEEASFDTRQNETIWNVFTSVSGVFSDKLSAEASLSAEFYKATNESKEEKSTIWNDKAFFPSFNISYTPASRHIFQFSLSSDKNYPSYWSLNPSVYHFSAYGVIYGNPYLRPQRNYNAGITYIYKQKYVFRVFMDYTPDYFIQLPYQSREKLQQEFTEQNFDFKRQTGLLAVIPFTIGKRISSRFVTNGLYWREKDDTFFDIPFNRTTLLGYFQLNSDIDLSSKPDIKMNISGYYSTPNAIQGIYDLGASGDLSAGLTWTFDRERAKLILNAGDILNTRTPSAKIDYMGQKSRLDAFQDNRQISLSFIYRFGGFKEKEKKEIDTSRFGGL